MKQLLNVTLGPISNVQDLHYKNVYFYLLHSIGQTRKNRIVEYFKMQTQFYRPPSTHYNDAEFKN